MRIAAFLLLAWLGPAGGAALAQTALTLDDAMRRARTLTPEARALAAADEEAAARIRQARAGYFPRVDVTESIQRGDHPVFAFSSLLAQRRFTAEHFAIGALNDPAPVTNVRTGVAVEQPIFDGGLTRLAVRGAEIGRDAAAAARANAGQDLAAAAAQRFVRVLQAEAAARASDAAVASARSSLDRARARRGAGLVTDADALAIEVHLADMQQRAIAAAAEAQIARIELSEAIGAPIGEPLALMRPPLPATTAPVDTLVRDALAAHPVTAQASLAVAAAAHARQTARAAFLPRVGVEGGWEANGSTLRDQQSSWMVGARVQINLFRGLGDRARLAEAQQAELRATADRDRTARRVEVDVRSAAARLDAARAREAVGRAALAQARDSERIVRDRYENGLATVTDVLRGAEATLDAESRATAAEMDAILSAVALDRAIGRL